ncbi:MAG: hypothetical protein BGO07_00405 [Alphaproteobacteria bacterium 40-19]|nr:MAG: hypothetical protein BGO07_00405 [Alphaproteobacteria bacterium 40-19]
MKKVLLILFLTCLQLHATKYADSKFVKFLSEMDEDGTTIRAFKSSISESFKATTPEKLYSILDKLIEEKSSKEITDIYSKILSLLNSHTSEAEILKALEKLNEDSSIKKTIKELIEDFLKKVPSEYLEKEHSADHYHTTLKNGAEKIIKKYGAPSIKKIKDALNKQLSVTKEQEELFKLPKELQEKDLQANIQKITQNKNLSQVQRTEKIDSLHFDHANRFRKPVLSMMTLEGIFYMLEQELEEEKLEKEKNPSISGIKIEPELNSVLKNVDPDLKTWILDRIQDTSEVTHLPTTEITNFLKHKISKNLVGENAEKGDVKQFQGQFTEFLNQSVLENTEEKNNELKAKILSNQEYNKILKDIDPAFANEIRAEFDQFNGHIKLEKNLTELVQNLKDLLPNLKKLEDPEDLQTAYGILDSTLNTLKPSIKRESPLSKEEKIEKKPSKKIKKP